LASRLLADGFKKCASSSPAAKKSLRGLDGDRHGSFASSFTAKKIVPALVEKFGYKSVMQVPRI
jgi:hypothetical protein